MWINIPDKLRDENFAVMLVREYFATDTATGQARHSGAFFDLLGFGGDKPETAFEFTAEDLLAVSMLSVPIVQCYALHLLEYQADDLSALLRQIPPDVSLLHPRAEALIAQDGPAWELWQMIHDIRPWPGDHRLGKVAAGKLLARKRPHLIPVLDSHVKEMLDRPGNDLWWWRDLRCQLLNDPPFVRELEVVRARADAGHLSLLRTFDIMCWMLWDDVHKAG